MRATSTNAWILISCAALASDHRDALFALYGPVSSLSEPDLKAWKDLLTRPNVMTPGPVDPDRLPDLYAAADVGIIPYRQYALLVDNGLPLKALEMCATGLPIVTSLMKPLLGMAAGLVVTSSPDEFVEAFSRTSRAALSPADLYELSALSAANDYDKKFDQILAALRERVNEPRATTRVDRLIEALGPEWLAAEVRLSEWMVSRLPSQIQVDCSRRDAARPRSIETPARVESRRVQSRREPRGLMTSQDSSLPEYQPTGRARQGFDRGELVHSCGSQIHPHPAAEPDLGQHMV